MITTGSKLLLGSTLAAAVFAAVYGVTQAGTLGTIGLVSAAVALSLLAGIVTFTRDSNVSASAPGSFEASAAADHSARPSAWPLLAGLGATTLTLGLVTERSVFILGFGALVVVLLEWVVQGWSERASGDARFNSAARESMAHPFELPVGAAAFAAIGIYSISRVMLGLPSKSATVVAFAVGGALVLGFGALGAARRSTSKGLITGLLAIVAVVVVAAGATYGFNLREVEPHHTPTDLAEENECGPEETPTDEHASQIIALKSNLAAELIYTGDSLIADVPGFDGDFGALTLQRSTPANVMFRNESGAPARLVIEMHPSVDGDGVVLGPERLCTGLVIDGGVQLLTLVFTQRSRFVENGYEFTVPGSYAVLPVVIP